MGSSSMPGGSTPVSSASMMSGQFIGKFIFLKKDRSQLSFLILLPLCDLISVAFPLLYNDYLIDILTCMALPTRFQNAFETWYTLMALP